MSNDTVGIKVVVKTEEFGKQVTSWNVPAEFEKAYATFLIGWINKGLVEASKAIADGTSPNARQLLDQV